MKRIVGNLGWYAAPVAALVLAAAPAAAQSKSKAHQLCETTKTQLEVAEQQGHLLEAKELALSCSAPTCGAWLSQQCRARYQALSADIPTIVPVAVDEKGAPIEGVELRIDGGAAALQVSGRALTVDPGVHELSFSAPGRETHVEKLVIVQGARNRQVSVVLAAAAAAAAPSTAPAPEPPASTAAAPAPVAAAPVLSAAAPHSEAASVSRPVSRHTSVWPYVVGGVGLASLGVSVAFATWGHQDNQLLDQCKPDCKSESLRHVRNMYIAADVSLGVGVVALGVATWMYFSQPSSAPPADRAQLEFDVTPVRGGAFATVEQSF